MSDWNPSPVPDTAPSPPPSSPSPQASSPVHAIFVGPRGIRAGWRFALYVVMLLAIGVALAFLLQTWRPPKLWELPISDLLGLVACVVPAVIMAKIERRRFEDYGLPIEGAFGKPFWIGALWGILAITLLMCVLRAAHAFYFGGLALHGIRIVKFAFFWGGTFVLVGLFEEYLTRGYSLFTLSTGMGFWPSAGLLSFLFGFAHLGNEGETWYGGLAAALIGLFFCLTLRRTGTLWFAVGFHFSFDWGETFLYSVPNSGNIMPGHLLNSSFHGRPWLTGGTVGPEGSVFVFLVIALLWIAFDRVYRDVKYRPT